jgi:hypothetical protein
MVRPSEMMEIKVSQKELEGLMRSDEVRVEVVEG